MEMAGSFNSFNAWLDAFVGQERQALESPWHCKRLVTTMGAHEKKVTQSLLKEGAVFGISADGLDRTYQVEAFFTIKYVL